MSVNQNRFNFAPNYSIMEGRTNIVRLDGVIDQMGRPGPFKNSGSYCMSVRIRTVRNGHRDDVTDCVVWNEVAQAFFASLRPGSRVIIDGCLVATPQNVGTPYEYTRYVVRIDKFYPVYNR